MLIVSFMYVEIVELVMGIREKVVLAVAVGIGFVVGFIRGYDSGFNEGMRTGEIKELVNQGFSIEDAKEMVKGRARMITTSQELFQEK